MTTKQRITLFLDPTLVKHARARAVIEDVSLARLVSNALINYLPKKTILKRDEIEDV